MRGEDRLAVVAVLHLSEDEFIDELEFFLKIFSKVAEAGCGAEVGHIDADTRDDLGGNTGGGVLLWFIEGERGGVLLLGRVTCNLIVSYIS